MITLENFIKDKLVMIERKFDKTISDKLENTTKIINEKITKVGETYADKVKQLLSSGRSIEQPEINLRQIMQQTKNYELVEQRERSLRERNFIIHGLPEENSSDKTANSDTNDHEVIKAIFREIKVGSVPKSFTRLGKPNAGARPIKVTMGTMSEKDNIMENLEVLKTSPRSLEKN